jgi:hypothetical protein
MAINFDIKAPENFLSSLPWKRILAVITLVTGLAVLLPDVVLEKLFILGLRNAISVVLGCVFFVSVVVWIVILAMLIFKRLHRAWSYNDKNCKKRFDQISDDALKLIMNMYSTKSYTMDLDMSSATVELLEARRFISRSSIVDTISWKSNYYLQPWVIRHLEKHTQEYLERLKQK